MAMETDIARSDTQTVLKQIEEYINFEEIGNIKNLNKYIVIAINDKLYVEKV